MCICSVSLHVTSFSSRMLLPVTQLMSQDTSVISRYLPKKYLIIPPVSSLHVNKSNNYQHSYAGKLSEIQYNTPTRHYNHLLKNQTRFYTRGEETRKHGRRNGWNGTRSREISLSLLEPMPRLTSSISVDRNISSLANI